MSCFLNKGSSNQIMIASFSLKYLPSPYFNRKLLSFGFFSGIFAYLVVPSMFCFCVSLSEESCNCNPDLFEYHLTGKFSLNLT